MKPTPADLRLLKNIARDRDLEITDEQAARAFRQISENVEAPESDVDYGAKFYEAAKQYFG